MQESEFLHFSPAHHISVYCSSSHVSMWQNKAKILMLFCHLDKKMNVDGQREEGSVKTSLGVTLSLWRIKETVSERCCLPHSISHLKHTAAHPLFMCAVSEWKGCCFEHPGSRSLQSSFELRRKKKHDAHFTLDDSLTLTSFSMSTTTKSFDSRYFINACWPQWGAATAQHMWDMPQFSQQHMYVYVGIMCECGCVTSIRQRVTFIMCSVETLWRGSVESDSVRAEVSNWAECC